MPKDLLQLYYHLHHNQHMEDLPFWLDLATQQGGELLELGCGTGRLLARFVEAGYRAIGLDIDYQMLATLQRLWPNASGSPEILQADMAHFHLDAQFPLILLPCNTLSILSQTARRSTFACAAAHLSPHGIFAASLPNPLLLQEIAPVGDSEVEDFFLSPEDGEPVQVSSAWERAGAAFTVTWHYDHLFPDGRVERLTMSTRHSLIKPDAYLEELDSMGLRVINVYGDFDKSPFTPEAPQLILLAAR